MANLTESATYDAGVYQLETTDPVQGGASGVSNTPLKNLANRTTYLKQHLDNLESGATIPSTVAPLASPAFTGTPTAPTQALGDNTTKIATTAFVQSTVGGRLAKSVAGGVNVTLTAIEAGNALLEFTGALTANISVILPTAPTRAWVVKNSTSGVYTLTVKTAAGTGVPVTQSKVAFVFTDGTNVYDALTDFDSIALTGTPTVPTAAVNTNTTQIASTAFVISQAATVAPLMDGTAAVGTGTTFARADHVHPTDTSRAPLASPAFTGNPTAPTPAQFDNDTSLATTQFVKRQGLSASKITVLSANTTLTAADAGSVIVGNGSSGFTVTLPAANTFDSGAKIEFMNIGTANMTVTRSGTDQIATSNTASTSVVLGNGDNLIIESNASGTWHCSGGSAQLKYAAVFGSSFTTNGYQKLPNGLIIQWGLVAPTVLASSGIDSISITFPISFTTACIFGLANQITNGSGSSMGYVAANVRYGSPTVSGMIVDRDNIGGTSLTFGFVWIAIGY